MNRCSGWAGVPLLLSGVLAVAGCDAPPTPREAAPGVASEPERIASFERPEILVAGASHRLADLISAADVGQTFGVPDSRVPYADTYWPFVTGGIDVHWQRGHDSRSPLEKYMALANPWESGDAQMWEMVNHGPGEPGLTTWHGHCPGWAAAATTNAPILHPVLAGSDGRGNIIPCREGHAGCIRFEIGDVNALMAEVYLDGPFSIIGATCNVPSWAIPRDRYGRILYRGCNGVNPGSLLITAVTLLRNYHVPFAMNYQKPTTTDEVWNQPVYAYHVYAFQPLSTAEATNLVAHGGTGGPNAAYPWDAAARGFAFLDLGIRFVGEEGPNLLVVPGTKSTYEMRVAAVLELDGPADNPATSVLGGEYLDLPSSNSNRLRVAPYLWVSRGAGPEVLSPYAGGSHHNPYVRPSVVKRIIALGQM